MAAVNGADWHFTCVCAYCCGGVSETSSGCVMFRLFWLPPSTIAPPSTLGHATRDEGLRAEVAEVALQLTAAVEDRGLIAAVWRGADVVRAWCGRGTKRAARYGHIVGWYCLMMRPTWAPEEYFRPTPPLRSPKGSPTQLRTRPTGPFRFRMHLL